MNECPKCGAKLAEMDEEDKIFACDSVWAKLSGEEDGLFIQEVKCCQNQIARLEEQVEHLKDLWLDISDLRTRLAAWREYYKVFACPSIHPEDYSCYQKLKDLGEI